MTGIVQIDIPRRRGRVGVSAKGYAGKSAVTVRRIFRSSVVIAATAVLTTATVLAAVMPSMTTATAAIALVYANVAVAIAANRLSAPAPNAESFIRANVITAGASVRSITAARISAHVARITKIAHNRISIPLVYLR